MLESAFAEAGEVNSMPYGIVWVRKASLFFKAFQNGRPNWKKGDANPEPPLLYVCLTPRLDLDPAATGLMAMRPAAQREPLHGRLLF
jgi:hypothetical protein